jgi:hypothetical protein
MEESGQLHAPAALILNQRELSVHYRRYWVGELQIRSGVYPIALTLQPGANIYDKWNNYIKTIYVIVVHFGVPEMYPRHKGFRAYNTIPSI